jgi:MFS family permease
MNELGDQQMTFSTISRPPERRWAALALIITAQFMVILDVAIVNVALPSIQTDLHFSQAGLQWVISAYAILFGGVLLLGGRLADLLGRRRLFVAGLALFALSSLLCGIAWSAGSLVAFRALQGLGGALLAPAALSLLMTTFREGRERNLALGIYGAASGSGAAAGVLLGGVLTSYLSWSWIFFVNVPVGVIAITLTPWLLRESRADLAHRHFDIAGATAVTAGLMLLVYAMTRATTDGWGSATTLGLIGGAVALIAAFVAIELRSTAALLPPRIFRVRQLVAANATMAIVGAVAVAVGEVGPALAQHERGDQDRGDADRDVDEEDPGPAEVRGEHAAEEDARGRAAARGGAVDPEREVALPALGEGGHQERERGRRHQRAAEALEGAEGDQRAL